MQVIVDFWNTGFIQYAEERAIYSLNVVFWDLIKNMTCIHITKTFILIGPILRHLKLSQCHYFARICTCERCLLQPNFHVRADGGSCQSLGMAKN